jgi:hypothetical protein
MTQDGGNPVHLKLPPRPSLSPAHRSRSGQERMCVCWGGGGGGGGGLMPNFLLPCKCLKRSHH